MEIPGCGSRALAAAQALPGQLTLNSLFAMPNQIKRRSFVKTTIAAGAAINFARAGAPAAAKPFDPKGLPTRKLGRTGVEVPLIGFGLGSRWMAIEDDDRALGILAKALDQGLYYWDTAANYSNPRISSEERIGRLLPARRKEVFLVTKVPDRDADKAMATVERSLKRLKTDYLDLLHVHALRDEADAESLGGKGRVLEALHKLRDQGVVKHIGFTGHSSAAGMKRAAELFDFEVMMIALNHQAPAQKFEDQAAPFAAAKGLGVVAMKVIRPRESVAGLDPAKLVRYALGLPPFALANIGIDSLEVLEKNLDLARNFKPLGEAEVKEMQAALEPFFRHQGVAWMRPGYCDGLAGDGLPA
jgi:uncharacterized protein